MNELLQKYSKLRDEQLSIYEYYARQYGMNYKGLLILLWLFRNSNGITQTQIAQKTLSTKQVVNAIIKNYMQKDYVICTESDTDKRQKVLKLTDKGYHYAKAIIEPLDDAENAAFSLLTNEEQTVLIQATQTFSTTLKERFAQKYQDFGEIDE